MPTYVHQLRKRIDALLSQLSEAAGTSSSSPSPASQGYGTIPSSESPSSSGPSPAAQANARAQAASQQHPASGDASKIEPKVWLAAERTYLNWLRVSLLISSFALALFNSAGKKDYVGKSMGVVYCAIAVGMTGYAWYMQRQRRRKILTRYAGHHGTSSAPAIVLCSELTSDEKMICGDRWSSAPSSSSQSSPISFFASGKGRFLFH